MGWMQTSEKGFRDALPTKLIAFEVREPAGFVGDFIHLQRSGTEMFRAGRIVHQKKRHATREYEDPRKREFQSRVGVETREYESSEEAVCALSGHEELAA